MSKKIQFNDKVSYQGKEYVVEATTKNFVSKVVRCKLKGFGELVDEKELTLVSKEGKEPKPEEKKGIGLAPVVQKYTELMGKKPPQNKKNDIEWIKAKIAEKLAEPNNDGWETLQALDSNNLKALIEGKGLDVDPEYYEGDEEGLRVAIAEKLGVEMPK